MRKTVRIETVMRYSVGDDSAPRESRSTRTVDYANDRSLYVDPTTGCRMITVGDDVYSEVPPDDGMPEGKRWVGYVGETTEIETLFEQGQEEQTETTGDGGVVVSSHMFFEKSDPDPDQYLDHLRGRSDKLELVGEEDVRGSSTTHYRAKVDVRRGIRLDLEADGWKPANVDRYLEQVPNSDEVVDVWVGDDGLVRRVVTVTTNESGEAPSFETVTTADYLDYGLETHIEAPPVAEVLDWAEWEQINEERLGDLQVVGEVGTEPIPEAPKPDDMPSCLH